MKTKPIVIVGGGFAGLRAALDLDRRLGSDLSTPIFLIDQSATHLYGPSLFDLVRYAEGATVAIPFQEILQRTHIRHIHEKVTRIDLEAQVVFTEHRKVPYHDLVLALGSQITPVKSEHGQSLEKSTDGIALLREQVMEMFKQAAPKDRTCQHQIVVIGGGPTGVEAVAGLVYLTQYAARHFHRSHKLVRLSLLEAKDRILPTWPIEVSRKAHKFLKHHGVQVITNAKVDDEGLAKAAARTSCKQHVFWAIGTHPHPLYGKISGLRHDQSGRVLVDASLQSVDHHNVWVIGDGASVRDSGTYPAAVAQGKHVARAIVETRKGEVSPAYVPRQHAMVLLLSPRYGLVSLGGNLVEGILATMRKRLDERVYLQSILPFRYLRLLIGKKVFV